MSADTFSCLLCGTTTPMPHVCPVFYPERTPDPVQEARDAVLRILSVRAQGRIRAALDTFEAAVRADEGWRIRDAEPR